MQLDQTTTEQLKELESSLNQQYLAFQKAGLTLDLTRGKPSAEQLSLSDALDGILEGNYKDSQGTDLRNYGGLDGIPEAKALFADMMGVKVDEILIGGNASLSLMYTAAQFALYNGVNGPDSAWIKEGKTIKFLAPVPGYDRHFSVCEHLGIELVNVPMNEDGPDMDVVEQLVKADPQIKGIWCVPRFSNPTGTVYSDAVVTRLAKLPKVAGPNFRVFCDNAYAVHVIEEGAPELCNVMDAFRAEGTEDSLYLFGSTSKITFAGAGVSFFASSTASLSTFRNHLAFTTIGPNKIDQARHVKLLGNMGGVAEHMAKHAAILKPRFDAVLSCLEENLAGTGMATWTVPQGGYFVSFDGLPGTAKTIIKLAAEAGVKLTPAGATFPYGKDPEDKNIRIAPSFPKLDEIKRAMDVFVVCVKLATVRQKLS